MSPHPAEAMIKHEATTTVQARLPRSHNQAHLRAAWPGCLVPFDSDNTVFASLSIIALDQALSFADAVINGSVGTG